MSQACYRLIVAAFCTLISGSAYADRIPAFPGAEGAGKFAAGGRGGDVYYVTNLNDSGEGSLRHGIESASDPRTIVFDVAGVIYLRDRLTARNKSNLTIAGQTAPGEGVTLANRSFFIRDSDNVIVQNLRFAPGDGLTRPGTEDLPGHMPGGDPRSIRVWNSSNVIVDHVTARWGQEDNIGVSHGSANVTIQNSLAAEGLLNADHHKGQRSFAVIINGRHLSFIGNLLTQNASRNPRAGLNGTLFEWHNNVVFHPRGDAAFFDNALQVNYTGNVALAGPASGGPPAKIRGDGQPRIYVRDNFYDRNRNAPLDLDGTSATIVGDLVEVEAPFEIDSDYEPLSARRGYINALSRGGASVTRDFHDKRAVKDVVERGGSNIDRPDDVGGYGEIDSPEPAASTARDGIPDWWKNERGLDPEVAHHQKYADSGYTYLEKYLHSLMEPVRAPAATEEIVLEASEWPENAWPSVENGGHYVMLKFDVSSIRPGSIADARLEMEGVPAGTRVLARDPVVAASDWHTRAVPVDPETYSPTPWWLGEFFSEDTFDSPNLAVFLNSSLMHYGAYSDHGIVTLLIETDGEGESLSGRLILEGREVALSEPSPPSERERLDGALAAAGLDGDDAHPKAVPFGDGVKNTLKYAFNMDLASADFRRLERGSGDTAGLPAIAAEWDGSQLVFVIEFLRRLGSDLVYRPLYSFDLVDWNEIDGGEAVEPIDDDWERVTVTQPADDENRYRVFGKVTVRIP